MFCAVANNELESLVHDVRGVPLGAFVRRHTRYLHDIVGRSFETLTREGPKQTTSMLESLLLVRRSLLRILAIANWCIDSNIDSTKLHVVLHSLQLAQNIHQHCVAIPHYTTMSLANILEHRMFPPWDLFSAQHVLASGTYELFPETMTVRETCFSLADLIMIEQKLNSKLAAAVSSSRTIRCGQMLVLSIADGRIHLTSQCFSLYLSLRMGSDRVVKWRVLSLDLYTASSSGRGSILSKFHTHHLVEFCNGLLNTDTLEISKIFSFITRLSTSLLFRVWQIQSQSLNLSYSGLECTSLVSDNIDIHYWDRRYTLSVHLRGHQLRLSHSDLEMTEIVSSISIDHVNGNIEHIFKVVLQRHILVLIRNLHKVLIDNCATLYCNLLLNIGTIHLTIFPQCTIIISMDTTGKFLIRSTSHSNELLSMQEALNAAEPNLIVGVLFPILLSVRHSAILESLIHSASQCGLDTFLDSKDTLLLCSSYKVFRLSIVEVEHPTRIQIDTLAFDNGLCNPELSRMYYIQPWCLSERVDCSPHQDYILVCTWDPNRLYELFY